MCRGRTHSNDTDQQHEPRRCSCCDPAARRAARRKTKMRQRGHEGDVDQDFASAHVPARTRMAPESIEATYDPSPTVREARARKGALTPEEEGALAVDDRPRVRAALAANTATDRETLDTLADDDDRGVREAVARHLSTPADALARMAGDLDRRRDLTLARTIASHHRTPTAALEQWIESGTEGQAAIAREALGQRGAKVE